MSRAAYSAFRDHCGYFIVKAQKVEEPQDHEGNVDEDRHLEQLSMEEGCIPETKDIEKELDESFSVEEEKDDVEFGECIRRQSSASVKILNITRLELIKTSTVRKMINEPCSIIQRSFFGFRAS